MEHLAGFIIHIIDKIGYAGVFVLMMLESALIPIPSEVTMTFSGYLVSLGKMNLFFLSFVGALANLVGSLLAYWLGYWGEEKFIRKLIIKYGRYLLVSVDEFDHSLIWFDKYGENITFFSRLMPIVRTFISLPAGLAKMNLIRFSTLTFIGSFIWSLLLSSIGFVLGKNWKSLEVYYRKFEYVIAALIIVGIVFYIFHKIKKMKNSKSNE
jgi:membrane protein DedA with SNARE-associated domain